MTRDNSNANDTLQVLADNGVGLLEPCSPREERLAKAMEDFSLFCFQQEPQQCLELIQQHLDHPQPSAGILQGGSEEHEIYRLVLHDDHDDDHPSQAAGNALLRYFTTSPAGKRYASVLTVPKLQVYMLTMCDRFVDNHHKEIPRYTQLGNLMLILSFGPVPGQVRHIDDMDPNAQICLYMSRDCPTTVIYTTTSDNDDEPVAAAQQILEPDDLIEFWATHHVVPELLSQLLQSYATIPLASKKHTRFWGASWPTLQATIQSFGKLYLPIQQRLALTATSPGTTLIAAQNQVHAGPPTTGPRMFAFAIAIPEQESSNNNVGRCQFDEENDGEVQYNPVLFHVDLCCILFSIMDFEKFSTTNEGDIQATKAFLLHRLVELIGDHGKFYGQTKADIYNRLLGDDRGELRDWLRQLVQACMEGDDVTQQAMVLQQATRMSTLFYSPDMAHCKLKRRARKSKTKA